MSDERNFPWLNEVANGSAGVSQTQREMSPQSFTMDIEYDSVDEEVHILASATHAIPTPAIIHSDGDDAMDLDEDEVPSPSPGLVDHSLSNNKVSTSTIPSLAEYLAQSFNGKPLASDCDVFYEHSSPYASSGQSHPSRIRRDSRSPESPAGHPLDEPTWFDVLDPNSEGALSTLYTSFAQDISRRSSPADDDDSISVASIDNDQSPLNIWRTLLCQLRPHQKDEEALIEFVKAPLGECPDDE